MNEKKRVAIIGAGIGGMAAAYDLIQAGYSVSIRRACDVLRFHRATHYYTSQADPQWALRIRLRDLAQVSEGTGPVEIAREDQVKQVVVLADARDASVGKALSELKAEAGKLVLPPGYVVRSLPDRVFLREGAFRMVAEYTPNVAEDGTVESITFNRRLVVDDRTLDPEEYQTLKQVMRELDRSRKGEIVLARRDKP